MQLGERSAKKSEGRSHLHCNGLKDSLLARGYSFAPICFACLHGFATSFQLAVEDSTETSQGSSTAGKGTSVYIPDLDCI